MVLEQADKPIEHVYFPEIGLLSVVAEAQPDLQIEVGIIGSEGMTGIPTILGGNRSPNATYVQVTGQAFQIATERLLSAMDRSVRLRGLMLRFVQAFLAQASQAALANGRATVEKRLARWILMSTDRLGGQALPLTHELLALMLGVRRAGVTVALSALSQRGLISTKRGVVDVLNRGGLEKMAGGLYGVAEAEYRRLLDWIPARHS